jgi:hypothetical protein
LPFCSRNTRFSSCRYSITCCWRWFIHPAIASTQTATDPESSPSLVAHYRNLHSSQLSPAKLRQFRFPYLTRSPPALRSPIRASADRQATFTRVRCIGGRGARTCRPITLRRGIVAHQRDEAQESRQQLGPRRRPPRTTSRGLPSTQRCARAVSLARARRRTVDARPWE